MIVLGATAELLEIRHLSMNQGVFLPPGDLSRGANVCVIGSGGKQELFGNQSALGKWVRIGDRRFRVIGVLAQIGVSLGEDLSEVVIIPVATAQSLFNTASLFRIVVEATSEDSVERARDAIRSIIRERHEGEDDVTVISQDAVLSTFDRIFKTLTLSVGGIAAVSLVVAGIMIMNIMLVSVAKRRAEIGLLKALGAPSGQIIGLFLSESAVLSFTGAALGVVLAFAGMEILAVFFPQYPLVLAPWSPFIGISMALGTGIIFGVLPARRASRLEPALALSRR
jgi:putative ABC transport system permease protein